MGNVGSRCLRADNGFAPTIVSKPISGNRSGCRTVIDIITGASTADTNYEWGVGESSSSVSTLLPTLCPYRNGLQSESMAMPWPDGACQRLCDT